MTKALLKKQLLEIFAFVYRDKKTGKNRTGAGLVGYIFIFLAAFGSVMFMFFVVASTLCRPLVANKLNWLYFALMSIAGLSLGVFGSVFNTYATLYAAKDNDLLLSMPIPIRMVMVSRLLGVYIMGLMYELLVMIPATLVYFFAAKPDVLSVLFCILIPLVLSVLVLTLSCILGWVVALVSGKLKSKKIVTVFISLAFLGGYYYVCGNLQGVLESILSDSAGLAQKIKGIFYPLYLMGRAAEGSAIAMLLFAVIMIALFVAVYAIMSRSFLKLATANKGTKKVKYIEKRAKSRSVSKALLSKEFTHFFNSTAYMLNCGMGIILMVALGVVALIKQDVIRGTISAMFGENTAIVPLIAAALICSVTSMNDITAPSISLEGKNLWLSKILPVDTFEILKAKLNMHLILTLVPASILTVCIEIVLKLSVLSAVLLPVCVALFVYVMAMLGLICNLKMPNLNWTNEAVPIKQSMPVMIALFGGWVLTLALALIYYFARALVSPTVYFIIVCAVLLGLSLLLTRWIKTKGCEVFEKL